ncbi:cation:proton antiporter [Streptomyces johnsoniae]|uniref:Cation:proton antiporter n=1 Tax=Streptomyces johnsoniae TaxID=3075532 RepID=A0ABU2RXV0_9ACTN|nr:cation:proton antiporter [Streptomyces sp. DSM 41886]MDT0441568.1 cation:proton antiporter [Streptomyces sp. DSM 41886]
MTPATSVVAPIAHHELLVLLLQIGILLLAAILLGRLAVRLGMPAIVGELSAGVLLGPSLLAQLLPGVGTWLFPQEPGQMHLLDALGQLGVILLVGFTGMHVDLKLVRRQGSRAAGVSIAGLVLPLAFGIWIGLLLPDRLRADGADQTVFACFVGVAMCVSAIPVIARTLMDMRLIHRNIGQMILVAGTVDDAVGWVLVSLVAAMATTAGLTGGDVLTSLSHLALVLLIVLTVGRFVVRWVMNAALRSGVRGMPVVTAVVLVVLSAAGTQALELEAVFGAFLCGVLIGAVKGVDMRALEPLNTTVVTVLAPLFFATAGLRMDLTALGDPDIALWALAVVGVAVAGKFLGAFLGGLFSGVTRWEALALGAGMNARGVIEVIIAMIGVRLGLLTVEMYSIIVLVAVLTSLMAPPLLRLAMSRVEHTAEEGLRERRVLELSGAAEERDPPAPGEPRSPA